METEIILAGPHREGEARGRAEPHRKPEDHPQAGHLEAGITMVHWHGKENTHIPQKVVKSHLLAEDIQQTPETELWRMREPESGPERGKKDGADRERYFLLL
jgi:hypothetical protein